MLIKYVDMLITADVMLTSIIVVIIPVMDSLYRLEASRRYVGLRYLCAEIGQ